MSEQPNKFHNWFESRKDNLIRGVLTILFLVIGYFAGFLVMLIAIFQFIMALITGAPNQLIYNFGRSLCTYMFDLLSFVTYISEKKPFPFSPWPSNGGSGASGASGTKTGIETDKTHTRNY